ncbi:Chitin binding Peritrophin-A domain [Popillia japonica]|uniref:Chitin binding Peritrophin-A domain n=1 Tax=Popillia japonica TaxID=7064 RepID=A0AAW1IB76_POPJA
MRRQLQQITYLFLFQIIKLSVADPIGACPEIDGEYVTLLPHGSDCTKFYICNGGNAVVAECQSGLLFNPNLLVCDYPESAGCVEVSSGNESNSDNGSEEESVAGGAEEDDDEEEESVAGGAEEDDDEEEETQICDYPESAGCGEVSSGNESNSDNGSEEEAVVGGAEEDESAGCGEVSSGNESNSDNGSEEEAVVGGAEEDDEEEEESQSNGGGSQVVGECPEVDGEYVTLLPHESDCTKFYICNGGTPVVAECQSGLLFNPNLLVCDYPESAGCGGVKEDDDEEEESQSNGGGSQVVGECPEVDGEYVTLLPQSNGGGSQVVGECPEVDGEYVTLLPHESDCTKFYICNGGTPVVAECQSGTPVVAECQSGLLFNPNLLVCDYPESAGCGGVLPGNENNSGNGSEEQAVAGGAEEDDEEEEESQSNGGGSQVVGECPDVDGEYVSLLPHESDCTKFYICNEGTPVIAECPSVCDYPESAGCGGVSSGNESNSDNGSEEEAVAGGAQEDDEEEESQSNGGGSQVVGECPEVDGEYVSLRPEVDGEYVSLLPHESDCTKFYICNGGTPVVAECQSGLLFNPNLLVCDYPESAGCGGVSPGDENNSDNGSEEEAVAGGARIRWLWRSIAWR